MQVNIQTQVQQQVQQQHLTPQQVMVVRMLEMPIAQLEDNVLKELDSNPSIEAEYDNENLNDNDNDNLNDNLNLNDNADDKDFGSGEVTDFKDSDDASGLSDDDDYRPAARQGNDSNIQEFVQADDTTFIDTLNEQMAMESLTENERYVMEYIIGSLDDDGLLRKDNLTISDELAIYHNIFVEDSEIEQVIKRVQTFEPAGIGARSLQECLLLQVDRRIDLSAGNDSYAMETLRLIKKILSNYYDDFINNRWHRIRQNMSLTEQRAEELQHEIRHSLNPKPGAALGEVQNRSTEQITPDFIVHLDYEGGISFELNTGRVPRLHVVKEDEEFIASLAGGRSKAEKEALAFTQENVNRAHTYINALRQRNDTMVKTMEAIIHLQRQFFLEGDENDLRPMALKDVAQITGQDLSNVSRVCRAKYVQTPWGTFPLRHFFSEGYATGTGEVTSTKVIKNCLKEIIAGEDSRNPLSDQDLVAIMKKKGYPIARRTIAKYREQLGIPISRLRKTQ